MKQETIIKRLEGNSKEVNVDISGVVQFIINETYDFNDDEFVSLVVSNIEVLTK